MDEHADDHGDVASPPHEGISSPPHEVPSLWGEPQVLTASLSRTIVATRAGNGLALIFEDLAVDLNTDTQSLVSSAVASWRAPLTPDENRPFLGYLVTVEGRITKDRGARAVLLADAAGQTKTLEFPYGEERGKAEAVEAEDTGFVRLEFFGVERRGSREQYADGQRPALPPFTVTLLLTAQRSDAREVVLFNVNSMSVEAFEL